MGWRGVLVVGLAVFTLGGGVAFADHNGHEFDTWQECMDSGGFGLSQMPTCTRAGDGPWVARYPGSAGDMSGAFGAFVMFALLWSAAPAVIGGFVAADRGQSVGLAVLLGIVLGWIGLIIVVVAFKPEVATATRSVIDRATHPPTPPAPSAGPGRDVRSRLVELDRLKREGLITDEEHATRRSAILEDI